MQGKQNLTMSHHDNSVTTYVSMFHTYMAQPNYCQPCGSSTCLIHNACASKFDSMVPNTFDMNKINISPRDKDRLITL